MKDNIIVEIKYQGKIEKASALIYWIRIALSKNKDYSEPEIGDIVLETSHFFSTARKKLGLLCALGELIKIEKIDDFEKRYTIMTVEGKEQIWSNADLRIIKKTDNKE